MRFQYENETTLAENIDGLGQGWAVTCFRENDALLTLHEVWASATFVPESTNRVELFRSEIPAIIKLLSPLAPEYK